MLNFWTSRIQYRLNQLSLPLRLILPDGNLLQSSSASEHSPKLTISKWSALNKLIRGELGVIGSDIVEGHIRFEGSMRQLMYIAQKFLRSEPHQYPRNLLTRLVPASLRPTNLHRWVSHISHSHEKDAAYIQSHYDVSDDFYALWLDPLRVYSCAYFEDSSMSLAQAQEAKLDLICRKLNLQAGERFLDIGAGWGGLLLWAAEHYGVQATGITLSRNQFRHMQKCIEERGLTSQVKVHLMDYRDLDEDQTFDKIASVGMFEHVGRGHMGAYFDKIWRLLKPGGLLLNHGITAGGLGYRQLGAGMGDFIEKYIFPGGELLHVSEVAEYMAAADLELVDAENLRPHYAKTLWAWSDNLEDKLIDARYVLGQSNPERAENILQAYRLYLSGSALGFERGWMSLYQMLAMRSGTSSNYPFTRNYMYDKHEIEAINACELDK